MRIQQKLNNEKSKDSVNKDVLLNLNISGKNKLLPTNEINRIVNLADRFDVERQRCGFYRLIGTINPLISNPLFNLTNSILLDKNTMSGFNKFEFLDKTYPKNNTITDTNDLYFNESINKNLKEKDGWFGYYEPNKNLKGVCGFNDMEPKRSRFSFIPDNDPLIKTLADVPVKNWEIVVTYPKSVDRSHPMVNGGLLIIETKTVTVSTKEMTAFGIACNHNLSIGDTVKITGTIGYNGTHEVVSVGLDNGDYQNYYFTINAPNTGSISNSSRFKKIVNELESEYYFRKFSKIKTRLSEYMETDDYETYQAGFSQNIFSDQIIQYVLNEDINVNGLTDNLGRPISEIYVTTIKTSSNGLFTNVSSGIETPFLDRLNDSGLYEYLQSVPVINKIHNGGSSPFKSHTPFENNVKIDNNNGFTNNNEFYGDLVEYNETVLNETILAVISHRFNTINRETSSPITYLKNKLSNTNEQINLGPRQEGYFYEPHYQIKIREFSNYIEEGDSDTVGVPLYAKEMDDGRILWRDLLDIGFNETDTKSIDYPFLNGVHYLYNNQSFLLRRQDQFGLWGLYYSKFPADPTGDRITDRFLVNTESTVDEC